MKTPFLKTPFLTLLVATASAAAFAQGKILVRNDGRPVTLVWANTADLTPSGLPVPVTSPLPSGISLVFGLYAGTSSTSLGLISTYPAGPPAGSIGTMGGQIAPSHCILPFAGSGDYFMVKVWDGAYASYEVEQAVGLPDYLSFGQSIFSMTPGTGIVYPGIDNGGGTTWAAGRIEVYWIPEPSALALATVALVVGVLRRTFKHR